MIEASLYHHSWTNQDYELILQPVLNTPIAQIGQAGEFRYVKMENVQVTLYQQDNHFDIKYYGGKSI